MTANDATEKCEMARFTIESARAGLRLIRSHHPHEELAFFLALALITNTRGISHALVNRDAKKSPTHQLVIGDWRRSSAPSLRRFQTVLVAARNQFVKEFSATPLVVTTTSNFAPPTYEIPIYITFTPEIESVLNDKERLARRARSTSLQSPPMMRVDLIAECERGIASWESELDEIEATIRAANAAPSSNDRS